MSGDEQHRDRTVMQNVLCVAAHEDVADASPPPRSQYDEVGGPRAGLGHDELADAPSEPLDHLGVDFDPGRAHVPLDAMQHRLPGAVYLDDEVLDGSGPGTHRHPRGSVDHMNELDSAAECRGELDRVPYAFLAGATVIDRNEDISINPRCCCAFGTIALSKRRIGAHRREAMETIDVHDSVLPMIKSISFELMLRRAISGGHP